MTNEQTQARLAALEAERTEADIAVGLTGENTILDEIDAALAALDAEEKVS